jgi:opacity protein-like surface antigen
MFRIVVCVVASALYVTLIATSAWAAGLYLFGVGLQYDWSEQMTVGAASEFLDLGSAEIANLQRPAGTLDGDYSSNHVNFVALNVIWKF